MWQRRRQWRPEQRGRSVPLDHGPSNLPGDFPSAPQNCFGHFLQLHAVAVFADHTTRDMTDQVQWQSDSGLATIGTSVHVQVHRERRPSRPRSGQSARRCPWWSRRPRSPHCCHAANATLSQGTSFQLHATGVFLDGTTQDLTNTATWGATTAAVAVSAAGIATANSVGASVVSASQNGVTGSTGRSSSAGVTSIVISPENATLAAGTSLQLHATAILSNGIAEDVTSTASWRSSGSVLISASGIATCTGSAAAALP